jgi:hypothetical protein
MAKRRKVATKKIVANKASTKSTKERKISQDYLDELPNEEPVEEEIIDPDEGRYRDELRMGPPAGRDPLFDEDRVERNCRADRSTQRIRVDSY